MNMLELSLFVKNQQNPFILVPKVTLTECGGRSHFSQVALPLTCSAWPGQWLSLASPGCVSALLAPHLGATQCSESGQMVPTWHIPHGEHMPGSQNLRVLG